MSKNEIKVFCPHCGEEIVVKINDNFINLKNKLIRTSNKLDIEFGEQRGGEIKSE